MNNEIKTFINPRASFFGRAEIISLDNISMEICPERFYFKIIFDQYKAKIYCEELTETLIIIKSVVMEGESKFTSDHLRMIGNFLKKYVALHPEAKVINQCFLIENHWVYVSSIGDPREPDCKVTIDDKEYVLANSYDRHESIYYLGNSSRLDGSSISDQEKKMIKDSLEYYESIQSPDVSVRFI